jgi:hypothetical protein
METPTKILTRCEACGNQTLFVSPGGHLTCSWIQCPAPSVDSAREQRMTDLASKLYEWSDVVEKYPELVRPSMDLLRTAAILVAKARR